MDTGLFHMFNASTHRRGELVADEATLLFRSMAVGLLKVVATSCDALPALSVFENLTKAMYADKETLTLQEFVLACQSTQTIASVSGAWLRPAAASDAIGNAAQS
jgi:type IV secretory pathway ATPase VirB11/archaellum biosynthesis ATPase